MAALNRAVEDIEYSLLIEAIYQRFGIDYRSYQEDRLRCKLRAFMAAHSIPTISALQDRVLHEALCIDHLTQTLDQHPAGLFDPPIQMRKVRSAILPWLRSCPAPKVWVAECTAPEDVFGLAILLKEDNLHHKTRIYATGPSDSLLAEARAGKFSAELFADYERDYLLAGGSGSLADHCTQEGDQHVFNPDLRSNITWAQYSLCTDASFNEFEVIVCRGGMADFSPRLQRRALQIFYDSQPVFGMLTLADQPLGTVPLDFRYRVLSSKYGIYQRGM